MLVYAKPLACSLLTTQYVTGQGSFGSADASAAASAVASATAQAIAAAVATATNSECNHL